VRKPAKSPETGGGPARASPNNPLLREYRNDTGINYDDAKSGLALQRQSGNIAPFAGAVRAADAAAPRLVGGRTEAATRAR